MAGTALFGTSGIRGDAQKLFTNQFSFDLGRAFAQFLDLHQQLGPIALGMDPRQSSPRIATALQSGLGLTGRKILDQGGCPIPAVNYILRIAHLAGSVEVTGSHVAPDLNGMKFFAFEEEILKEHEAEISKIYAKIKEKVSFKAQPVTVIEDNSARAEYEEMLVKLASPLPNWTVVVDPGNGAQSELASRVLNRIGLKVVALNDQLQGNFMSRDTEKEGSFKQLQEAVVQNKAFLGIGFDADGDRVIFIDGQGRFIPGDYSCSLIAKYSDTEVVVTPINTSQVVEKINKPVIRTQVGSPYVVAAMKKNGATFGFEGNGGGISAGIMMSRDGGSTMIKLLNTLAALKKSLAEALGELPWFFILKDKTDCPMELNQLILAAAKKKYQGKKIEEVDGLKVWPDSDSWILFRPSSNAPEFRVFAETVNQDKTLALVKEGICLVQSIIRENEK